MARRWPILALGLGVLPLAPAQGRVAPAHAVPAPAEQVDRVVVAPLGEGGGAIDWTRRTLRARACSPGSIRAFVPPEQLPYAQRRAESLAQDGLLRLLRAVVLGPCQRQVGDLLADTPSLEPVAHASVQGMQVVSTRYGADGTVALEVELPLDGEHPGLGALWAAVALPVAPGPAGRVAWAPAALGDRLMTGIVINARGTGFVPSLWPRIVDAQGVVLYDATLVPKDILVMRGLMGAAHSLEAAQRDERVMPLPRVLGAQSVASPKDVYTLVLGDADAQSLLQHPSLLQEARVVVVVD